MFKQYPVTFTYGFEEVEIGCGMYGGSATVQAVCYPGIRQTYDSPAEPPDADIIKVEIEELWDIHDQDGSKNEPLCKAVVNWLLDNQLDKLQDAALEQAASDKEDAEQAKMEEYLNRASFPTR